MADVKVRILFLFAYLTTIAAAPAVNHLHIPPVNPPVNPPAIPPANPATVPKVNGASIPNLNGPPAGNPQPNQQAGAEKTGGLANPSGVSITNLNMPQPDAPAPAPASNANQQNGLAPGVFKTHLNAPLGAPAGQTPTNSQGAASPSAGATAGQVPVNPQGAAAPPSDQNPAKPQGVALLPLGAPADQSPSNNQGGNADVSAFANMFNALAANGGGAAATNQDNDNSEKHPGDNIKLQDLPKVDWMKAVDVDEKPGERKIYQMVVQEELPKKEPGAS